MHGRRISQVQQLGLEILLTLDDFSREKDQVERMRHALLTANPALARGLYPEYFEAQEEDDPADVNLDRENAAYDFSRVEFESPQNMPDEEMLMIQRLLGNTGITVGTPVEPQEGLEGAPGLSEPDEPEWT